MRTRNLPPAFMRHAAFASALGIAFVAAIVCAQSPPAGDPVADKWPALLKEGKASDARVLCEAWLQSSDLRQKTEAHKCLANVALSGAEVTTIQAGDTGGGYIGGGYKPEAIDEALAHLKEALKLMPQDLSVHKGRLHLLSFGGRFAAMPKALEESLQTYEGSTVDTWIAYSYELFDAQQYRSGIELLKVLEKTFPNDHQIVGNLGAMYGMLKDDRNAVAYLRRAVELAPDDPIDTWNLGRTYDYTGETALADKWYTKSLGVDSDAERTEHNWCVYAEFVETKRKQPQRACDIQKKHECKPKACKQ